MGRGTLSGGNGSIRLACGHVCVVFSWLIIDGEVLTHYGQCQAWAGGPGLFKKVGWVHYGE